MCGIAGIVGTSAPDRVWGMVERLAHRGPDGRDAWVEGRAGFGHARLAIVDPLRGRQPMRSGCGRYWSTFSGEIYNHQAVRDRLQDEGHRLSTECDAEVVLAGYQAYGEDVLEHLDGMFAFGVWDRARERLWLARDRLGIKPLYYAVTGSGLAFASEPKALLDLAEVSREFDPRALDAYLDLLYVPAPHSIHRGIRQLPPAHALTWTAGTTHTHRYWAIDVGASERHAATDRDLDRLLRRAVARRARAEVDVGVMLSGGLDSSVVGALATRSSHRPLHSFCVGFGAEGASYDERGPARAVASHLGTRHHEWVVGAEVLDQLDPVVRAFDEPFGSPTALLAFVLLGRARDWVKVVLTGDGGDEVFGGYPRYWASVVAPWVPRSLADWGPRIFAGDQPAVARSYRRWGSQFLGALHLPADERYARWVGYRSVGERRALLTPEVRAAVGPDGAFVQGAYDGVGRGDPLVRASAADLVGFLPENVLRCSERMGMAHGVEVRVPMCDHLLVQAAIGLGWRRKLLWGSKAPLRSIAARHLPPELRARRKRGFNGPTGMWLRERLPSLSARYLDRGRLQRRGWLDPSVVHEMLAAHRSGAVDHGVRLWSLIALEHWCEVYLDAAAGVTRAAI